MYSLSSDFSLFGLLLCGCFWVYVHQRLSPTLPYFFLPAAAWKEHSRKIQLYKQQQQQQKQLQQQQQKQQQTERNGERTSAEPNPKQQELQEGAAAAATATAE
ncbi:uncharacterized protein EMH_0003770, partial [Eimeria mitis]